MRRTLAWRLAARYLLVLAALLAVSAGFQYVALRHFLLAAAAARLQDTARQPVAAYRAAVTAGVPVSTAAADLVRAVTDPRTQAWIAPADGLRAGLAASPRPTPPKPLGGPGREPRPPSPPRPPSRPRVAHGELQVAVPLGSPRHPSGATLVLATRVQDILAVLGSEVRLLLLGGAVALAFGGASGALAVREALRPLRHIAHAAERIAAGDLGARARQEHAPEEVARLAGAFDSMVDRLAAAISEERATHQQMRRLLDDASHELRTPLTALSGTLEVLQGDAGEDPGAVREGLRSAYRQARRMGALVSGLLALARADRPGGLPLRPTDLGALVASLRPAAERLAADHQFRWVGPDGALPVLADAETLGGALLGVLDNAVRYSPIGTAIRLQARPCGDAAEVCVADEGPGIPADCLSHVFDRFYRCPPGRGAPAPPGTGLGLAIVRSVMERHHGTATIESAVGRGTTVRLRLPLRMASGDPGTPGWPGDSARGSGEAAPRDPIRVRPRRP